MNKKWIIQEKKSDDIIEQLLINRNIRKEDWTSFLKPDFDKDLFDPFLMKNMRKVVERISKSLENNEKIGIFGDYDADGIPGVVLMSEVLEKLGTQPLIYIPSREQGYGLNKAGIDEFEKNNVKLMITVDLGVRNQAEIKYALKKGIDTIVIDHHEMGETLSEGIVIDPKQSGDKYPFKELAATGVVFKLAQALSIKYKKINISYLKWSLDLVGISTICDIVPLISENRVFAKYGIIVLRKTKRIGLQELYKQAAIEPENIDTYSVGFQIGPRLNAPGRMEHALDSFKLLVSKNKNEAGEIAVRLDKINKTRQVELERVLEEAKIKVNKNKLNKKKVILVEGENWPHGIIGLVAGRLMEEYARPVFVLENKDGHLRGSARSVEGYDIVDALENSKKYLEKYGGHKKAAGVTLEYKHLESLYDKLLEIADVKLKTEDLIPKIKIDKILEKDNLKLSLVDEIKKFEPFGLGNPRPIFVLKDAVACNISTVGRDKNAGKHLKLKIFDFKAIGFDLGHLIEKIKENQKINIAFSLDEDSWDGERKVQLKILDIDLKR